MLGGIITPADRQGGPGSHEALQNATPDPGSLAGTGKHCALSGETKQVRPGEGIGVACELAGHTASPRPPSRPNLRGTGQAAKFARRDKSGMAIQGGDR